MIQADLGRPVLWQKRIRLEKYPNQAFSPRCPVPSEGVRANRHETWGGMRWTRQHRKTIDASADGEVVWYHCRRFEVPAEIAASPTGTSNRKRHWNHGFASALCFPKFVKGLHE